MTGGEHEFFASANHSLITGWLYFACLASNAFTHVWSFAVHGHSRHAREVPRRRLGTDPSRHPVRWRGHASVATVACVLSQAAPETVVAAHDAAGHRGAWIDRCRLRRTASGVQRRAPFPGRRSA